MERSDTFLCGDGMMQPLTTPIASARILKIAEAATERLRSSPYAALKSVLCESEHDILYLRGRLPSFYHKQLAQEAVAKVRGVTQVVNEIEVA
jgi:osmotically-inducible protein OsmY